MATFTCYGTGLLVGMVRLISSKEGVPFYIKKEFEERPCEWDGLGMFKMVR